MEVLQHVVKKKKQSTAARLPVYVLTRFSNFVCATHVSDKKNNKLHSVSIICEMDLLMSLGNWIIIIKYKQK